MRILISQKAPSNLNAFKALEDKYGASLEFHPFFLIEPLSAKEFRSQRINLPDYTAVVFSSRHAIDAFFALCEELRTKVPETMKYFCSTELVANYLQKHIVYRTRKIFFGDGTPASIVSLINPKQKGEKFLVTRSEGGSSDTLTSLFDAAGLDYSVAVMVKSVTQDLHDLKLQDYDIVVFYNPADVKSLYENFPGFQQGNIKFVSFGHGVVGAMEEAGLQIAVQAPTPQAPSAARAIEIYLEGLK